MKSKLFGIMFFILLSFGSADSQLIKGYGIKVGAVNANQIWDNDFPTMDRWGLDAGIFVEAFSKQSFSLLMEFHYVQKGFIYKTLITTEENPEGNGTYFTIKPKVNYFSIPFLFKIRFERESFTPYIIAGPRVDILIESKSGALGNSVFDYFKSTDFGISLGLGIEIPAKFIPSLIAEFRYSPSLTNSYSSDHLKIKNRSIEFLLGVCF